MRVAALSCALMLTAVAALADDGATVKVGDGTLDGAFLEPYNNAWFYTVTPDGGPVRPQGIWSDHLQRTEENGKPALMRVQSVGFLNGRSNVVINVFDAKTLAPIRSETHGIDGTIFRRVFDGAHITEVTLANGKDTTAASTSTDLPQAVYDFNGGTYGLLLAALPLKAGLTGALPAVADPAGGKAQFSTEPFHVLQQETVSAGAHGMMKTWKVESAKPGQYTMAFWLTKRAPYIIRLVMDDRAHKRTLEWNMI